MLAENYLTQLTEKEVVDLITAALPDESKSYLFLSLVSMVKSAGNLSIVKVAFTLQDPGSPGGTHNLLLYPVAPWHPIEKQVSQ